ncbi:hypothetical protein K2X30_14435 [bacterium]|jgi:hypothetical protein|nr:hypothetical protein [bacterium]
MNSWISALVIIGGLGWTSAGRAEDAPATDEPVYEVRTESPDWQTLVRGLAEELRSCALKNPWYKKDSTRLLHAEEYCAEIIYGMLNIRRVPELAVQHALKRLDIEAGKGFTQDLSPKAKPPQE